jgi:hypothetical protein
MTNMRSPATLPTTFVRKPQRMTIPTPRTINTVEIGHMTRFIFSS